MAYPTDRSHLEGQTVDVVQDGAATADQTVTSGALTLTGTTNHAGLHYTSTLKPTKISVDDTGMLMTKNITKAVISFYNTLKGKCGTATDDLYTISFSTTLFNGIKEVPIKGDYQREGNIVIRQDEPHPMTARGMILLMGGHDRR